MVGGKLEVFERSGWKAVNREAVVRGVVLGNWGEWLGCNVRGHAEEWD